VRRPLGFAIWPRRRKAFAKAVEINGVVDPSNGAKARVDLMKRATKRKLEKLWHWNLDCSALPEAWQFSHPRDSEIDSDDPDDTGYAMLSLDLGSDKLVLMCGGRGGKVNRWDLFADEGAVVAWGDDIVVTKKVSSPLAACRWALEVYLQEVDKALSALRRVLVAHMRKATRENCAEIMHSLTVSSDRFEDLVEQRGAAVAELAKIALLREKQ
jgi:hypothetical protein